MNDVIAFVQTNQVVLIGAALAVSEALALIPQFKSNSILQLLINTLKTISSK